jgi:metal-responsive CopG/Arc/MetJ family transcriptional regulator
MPRPRGKQLPNRICVSLDNEAYAGLNTLARDQGVSASWLVRRAVQELVSRHNTELLPELPLQRSAGVRRTPSA